MPRPPPDRPFPRPTLVLRPPSYISNSLRLDAEHDPIALLLLFLLAHQLLIAILDNSATGDAQHLARPAARLDQQVAACRRDQAQVEPQAHVADVEQVAGH